jgi:Tfp pilus assembly protein PilE
MKITKGKAIALVVVAFIAIMGLVTFSQYTSVYDRDAELRATFKAELANREGQFDAFKNTMKDFGGLKKSKENTIKELYATVVTGRPGQSPNAAMLTFVKESNPNYDESIYTNMMQQVKALRMDYANVQKRLADVKNQHDQLRTKFWSRMFLSNNSELKYEVTSTAQTKETMRTGVDTYENNFD